VSRGEIAGLLAIPSVQNCFESFCSEATNTDEEQGADYNAHHIAQETTRRDPNDCH
jgi:hypothetical protein